MELKIDPELSRMAELRRLSEREMSALEQSLVAVGCLKSIVVWQERQVIVDGHHRYEICKRRSLPFRTKELSFESVTDAQIWMLEHPDSQRNELPRERELRLGRLHELHKARHGASPLNVASGSARQKIADAEGVSTATVARAAAVVRALDEAEKVQPGATREYLEGETKKPVAITPLRTTDLVGRPIPESLNEVFAALPRFQRVLNMINALTAEIRLMSEDAILGVHFDNAAVQAATAAASQIRQSVYNASPYAVCPECRGKKGCASCRKSGWLGQARYKLMPAELRERR